MRRAGKPGVVGEDPPLEVLQRRARLEAELVDQRLACLLVRLERVHLPSRPVESEHEQAARTLAERMPAHELLQLGHELLVEAELQIGLDPVLERLHVQLCQAFRLAFGERLVRQLRQRRAAPHGESAAERPTGGRGVLGSRFVDAPLELGAVDFGRVRTQHVPRRPRHQSVAELLAQK